MSELPNANQLIETPAATTAPSNEPAMFVMPEAYRHGAVGKKMAEPTPVISKLATAPPPPSPPKPAVSTQTPKPRKRVSRQAKVLLVGGGVLVLGLAVAGFVVLRSVQPSTVKPEEPVKTTTREAPKEETATTTPSKVTSSTQETTTQTTEPSSPFPTASTPGTDSDSDGLTDLEEKLVYGTDPKMPDTDSDGFLDGNEVFHRYNPAGTAPGTLRESGLVKAFNGPAEHAVWYQILYPSVWKADTLGTDWEIPMTFTATTGEKVVVTTLQRTQGLDFADWVVERDPKGSYTSMTTKNGYPALISDDQLNVYIDGLATSSAGAGYALKITMDTGIKATIDYLQTFKMMLNSLEWL